MKTEFNWKKNLYPLFLSQFFYRAGTRTIIPFLPLYVKEYCGNDLGEAALWSGWIFAAPFIVSFITTPLWGSIGDKYGRKFTTLLAVFGFAIANILMGFSSSLAFLFLAAATQELFGGAYPAAVSLTAANSPKEKTTEALSYLQFANALGNIIGPILGGILADIIGYKNVFFVTAVAVSIASLPVYFFVEEENVEVDSSYHSLADNLRYFVSNRELLISGIVLLAYTLSLTMMRPNFTFFIQLQFSEMRNPATISGLLFGIFGAAGAISVGMLPLIAKKISKWNKLIAALSISSISFVLLIAIKNIYLFTIFLFVLGFMLGIILPLVYSIISSDTNHDRKAGVIGIGSSFQMIGNLMGPLAAGYITSLFGLHFSFVSCGIILVLAILIYKIREKDVKTIC